MSMTAPADSDIRQNERENNPNEPNQSLRIKLLLLFLLYALLASCTYRSFSRSDPFFCTPQVDEATNLTLAQAFLRDGFSIYTFWQEPLTFLYFAGLLTVGIDSPELIKFFHLFLLNPLIILILFSWSRLVFKNKALWVSALYAFSPLPIFLSLSLMKTLPAILLVLLCLYSFTRFFIAPGRKRLALAFVGSWFLAWAICQHLLLFFPVLLLAAARRMEKKHRPGSSNLILSAVSALILVLAAISLSSWITHKPLLTLTINGQINLHLANNRQVAETMTIWPGPEWHYYFNLLQEEGRKKPSAESGIVLDLPDSPGQWLSLYTQKIFWEFTPQAYFRQFSWNEARRISPWLGVYAPLTLLLLLLIFWVSLNWRRQGVLVRSLLACWWLYHLVNIVFIPGIARYNAVIWPLTALLAGVGLRRFRFRYRLLLLVPCLGLWFSHPPNDFQDDYIRFRRQILDISNHRYSEITIPENSTHKADYRFQRARALVVNKQYAQAEALLKQTPDWNYHGLEYTTLLAFCQSEQLLFMDALDTARKCYNWPKEDSFRYELLVIGRIDEMLAAYQVAGRLDVRTLSAIRTLVRSRLDRQPDNPPLRHAWDSLQEYVQSADGSGRHE